MMHDGYDVGLLNEGFRDLIKGLSLDALLIDTHPGFNEETLLSIAMSNALADHHAPRSAGLDGYERHRFRGAQTQGAAHGVGGQQDAPSLRLRRGRGPCRKTYGCEVAAVLPIRTR